MNFSKIDKILRTYFMDGPLLDMCLVLIRLPTPDNLFDFVLHKVIITKEKYRKKYTENDSRPNNELNIQ